MYCKNCGNQLQEGQKFCTKCGNRVEGPENNQANMRPAYQRQRGYADPSKAKSYATAYRVFAILLIIACIFFIQLGNEFLDMYKQTESFRQIKGVASTLVPGLNLIDDDVLKGLAGLVDGSLGTDTEGLAKYLTGSKDFKTAAILAFAFFGLAILISIYSLAILGDPRNMKKIFSINAIIFVIAAVITLLTMSREPILAIMIYVLIAFALASIVSFFLNRGINKELAY